MLIVSLIKGELGDFMFRKFILVGLWCLSIHVCMVASEVVECIGEGSLSVNNPFRMPTVVLRHEENLTFDCDFMHEVRNVHGEEERDVHSVKPQDKAKPLSKDDFDGSSALPRAAGGAVCGDEPQRDTLQEGDKAFSLKYANGRGYSVPSKPRVDVKEAVLHGNQSKVEKGEEKPVARLGEPVSNISRWIDDVENERRAGQLDTEEPPVCSFEARESSDCSCTDCMKKLWYIMTCCYCGDC